MKVASPVSSTDDTIITGVREAALTDGAAVEGALTMSGRERSPAESWPVDDEAETELPVPQGALLGGKYTIEKMFAEGGMGIVCLGRHVQLDQVVAIKFLRRALSGRPSIVDRFLNEARALAALRSEHVVRVMDVGQLDSGRPYLVMEHLEGVHLEEKLERDGVLGVESAISYVLQVTQLATKPAAKTHVNPHHTQPTRLLTPVCYAKPRPLSRSDRLGRHHERRGADAAPRNLSR